jgi:hypothetical protein
VTSATATTLEPLQRLRRDLKLAAITLTDAEARFLVDSYYQMQGSRIRAGNQVNALTKSDEPHTVLQWFGEQSEHLEKQYLAALGAYAGSRPEGKWALSITGIGPVITAALLAHIDISRVNSAGQIWRYAGLDPTTTWERKQKRPWNASLKVVAYKAGESFIKFHNNPKDHYGHFYVERKLQEQDRNEAGLFKDQAEASLREKNFGQDTEARKWYERGLLPPARIHARARRWAVKLFLDHYFQVAYRCLHKHPPANPYPLQILGHKDRIEIPNYPWPDAPWVK